MKNVENKFYFWRPPLLAPRGICPPPSRRHWTLQTPCMPDLASKGKGKARTHLRRYLEGARANRQEDTCGSLHLRLHKPLSDHLTATRFKFTVFCSGHPATYWLLLILPTPEGWKSSLSASGIEPGSPAHMSEHVSERLTALNNWASTTDVCDADSADFCQ